VSRQVNEEKMALSEVARTLGIPVMTVCRIAGAARGDPRYTNKTVPKQLPDVDVVMPPSPFPLDGQQSLRGMILSAEEKYYLACLVNVKRLSCGLVAKQFDMPVGSISTIAKNALLGKPLEGRGGLLPRLDRQADEALRSLAALTGNARPSREEMSEHILAEATRTVERRKAAAEIGDYNGPSPHEGGGARCEGENSQTEGRKKRHLSRSTRARYLLRYGFPAS